MSTASMKCTFQLSPALADASRASVNVDVPVFGKGSAGIALDKEAGETTAGEGVVETLTAPTWLSPPLVSGMPTKPSPPVILLGLPCCWAQKVAWTVVRRSSDHEKGGEW